MQPDGDVENLAHHLQGWLRLPTYLRPVLAGVGDGSAWAYALAAQAAEGTFGGVIGFGFCPQIESRQPLCRGEGTHFRRVDAQHLLLLPSARLAVPWTVLDGAPVACPAATTRRFVESVAQGRWLPAPAGTVDTRLSAIVDDLAARNPPTTPPAPASLADLPLIEMPAAGTGGRIVVLLSGDGGWAAIDKALAAAFVRQGLSVVGFDSLRYFWTPRTPESLAADLDRLMRYYAQAWKRPEFVLVGYSQGADVLPFAINRLPPATAAMLRYTALLGLGRKAAFEFHLSHWLGPSGDHPIEPEARRLERERTLCVHGRDERDSLCPVLAGANAQSVELPGDHHFGGDYARVAALIVQAQRTR